VDPGGGFVLDVLLDAMCRFSVATPVVPQREQRRSEVRRRVGIVEGALEVLERHLLIIAPGASCRRSLRAGRLQLVREFATRPDFSSLVRIVGPRFNNIGVVAVMLIRELPVDMRVECFDDSIQLLR
jgi:hypothetical protein